MGNKKLQDRVNKLQKKVEESKIIRTFADLISWEEGNKYTKNRPKIAKPLLDQLHKAGLYLDLK